MALTRGGYHRLTVEQMHRASPDLQLQAAYSHAQGADDSGEHGTLPGQLPMPIQSGCSRPQLRWAECLVTRWWLRATVFPGGYHSRHGARVLRGAQDAGQTGLVGIRQAERT